MFGGIKKTNHPFFHGCTRILCYGAKGKGQLCRSLTFGLLKSGVDFLFLVQISLTSIFKMAKWHLAPLAFDIQVTMDRTALNLSCMKHGTMFPHISSWQKGCHISPWVQIPVLCLDCSWGAYCPHGRMLPLAAVLSSIPTFWK